MLVQYWPQIALLHDHFDGSFPLLSILPVLHRMSGKKYPFDDTSQNHREHVKKWFFNDRNIVERFSLTTGVLQHEFTLATAAQCYVEFRHAQGFRYCEMTIAPQYHVFGGLTEKKVVEALIHGIKTAERKLPEMEVNILFSIGREVSPEEAVRLVNVAAECDLNYVVGIGLVCDEASHPPEKHTAMFRRAKELGFKTTCHAGEWVSENPDFKRDLPALIKNIRTAVFDLQVDRVGHAIGLPYDEELMKAVVDWGIGIEGCPGSNFVSGLIPDMKSLKIREMLEAGVAYSLHPDDDLFLPDLNETFQMCDREYYFNTKEGWTMLNNSLSSRFGKRKQHK